MTETLKTQNGFNDLEKTINKHEESSKLPESDDKIQIVWPNVFAMVIMHIFSAIGVYYWMTFQIQWKTFLWTFLYAILSSEGVTAGAHRLWCHRSYKATLPLKVILCIFQTMALQNCIYEWCRDHRAHHKFTDTNADPHNIRRGFFFAHMGWLLVRKHKDVKEKGKCIDLSDLEADPVVVFQRKYYTILAPIFAFLIPAVVPWYFWNERFFIAWCYSAMFRYILTLHLTWTVNSLAHMHGTRPYDKNIQPRQSPFVILSCSGEGYHNYHHTFPWDYKVEELSANYGTNFGAFLIDGMAKIGWAYDLKYVSPEMIKARMRRTGDQSSKRKDSLQYDDGPNVEVNRNIWGWEDVEITENEKKMALIGFRKQA